MKSGGSALGASRSAVLGGRPSQSAVKLIHTEEMVRQTWWGRGPIWSCNINDILSTLFTM